MVEDIRVARWPASRGCWRCACQFPSEAYKLEQQSERIYDRYRNCPRDRFGDLPQGASLRDHTFSVLPQIVFASPTETRLVICGSWR